jgi:hypothetical protein
MKSPRSVTNRDEVTMYNPSGATYTRSGLRDAIAGGHCEEGTEPTCAVDRRTVGAAAARLAISEVSGERLQAAKPMAKRVAATAVLLAIGA